MKQESTTTRHSLWGLALSLFLIAQTACMNNPSQFWADGEGDAPFQANGAEIGIEPEMLGSGRQEKVIGKFFLDNYLVNKKRPPQTRAFKETVIKWFEKNLSSEQKEEITKRILEGKDKEIIFRFLQENLHGNTESISQVIADIKNAKEEKAFTKLHSLLAALSKKKLFNEAIKDILALTDEIAGASLELKEKAYRLVTKYYYHKADDKTWRKLMKFCKSILGLSKEEKQRINKEITFGKGPFLNSMEERCGIEILDEYTEEEEVEEVEWENLDWEESDKKASKGINVYSFE